MIIDSEKKLNNFKNKIKKKKYLYLDTEFNRENTYKATLSFISIFDGKFYYILDALKYKKLVKPLINIISANSITKILHGSEQDLELIHQFGYELGPIFDNQLAAAFCGFERNLSYQNITKIICKKKIDKKFQNINWLKRPVSKKIISYLKNDTKYLKPTHKYLKRILDRTKKIKYFNEEMNLFKNNATNVLKLSSTLKRNIGINLLEHKKFKNILMIRNIISEKKNLPKNWVLSDNDIIKLLNSKNNNLIKRNFKISKEYKDKISKNINHLKKIKVRKVKIDNTLLASMNFIRLITAKKNKIDENLIASKNEIYNYLAYKKYKSKWRKKIFYDNFEKFIKGNINLKFKNWIIQF